MTFVQMNSATFACTKRGTLRLRIAHAMEDTLLTVTIVCDEIEGIALRMAKDTRPAFSRRCG